MNIWYLHHYATPKHIAGLHRPFEFGKYFIENGHDLTVFSSSYLHFANENMIEDKQRYREETYDGIKTVYIKTCGYASSGMKRIINMTQFYFRLFDAAKKQVKKSGRPDVIIASSPHPFVMIAGIKLAKKYGVKCICEVRDFWPEVFFLGGRLKEKSLIGRMLLAGEKWIYTKADSLVFLKEGDYKYIDEHGWGVKNGGKVDENKIYYVNNAVDLQAFERNMQENTIDDEDLKSDKFKVVYCGSIRPVNNVGLLVDAAKHVEDGVQILVYGSGSCLEELQNRVRDEHITNIKFKGYVNSNKIPFVLSKASVNILNYSANQYNWSRGNSSNKLFEYLASGKPVISTVKMGYCILEKYSCGLSTEECNGEKIAKSINYIKNLSKEEYANMCKNAQNAAKEFDTPKLAAKYLELINETIVKNKKEK